jgi:hypothetical protein
MIALYRPGDTHTVKGVKCKLGRFPNSELAVRLSEGWLTNVEDLTPKPRAKPDAKIRHNQ